MKLYVRPSVGILLCYHVIFVSYFSISLYCTGNIQVSRSGMTKIRIRMPGTDPDAGYVSGCQVWILMSGMDPDVGYES